MTETDPICGMQACMDGYELVSPFVEGDPAKGVNKTLMQDTDLVVTTTGNYHVCNSDMLKALKPPQWFCTLVTLIPRLIPSLCVTTGNGWK